MHFNRPSRLQLVWSAALASCAIPYVYAPVELMAKDATGQLVPYFSEGGVKFADGSIHSDLPMRRLAELFNVNHFIVSQVNPHVIPFVISDTSNDAFSPIGPALKLVNFLNRQVKSICLGVRGRALLHWNYLLFFGSLFYFFKMACSIIIRFVFKKKCICAVGRARRAVPESGARPDGAAVHGRHNARADAVVERLWEVA